MSKDVAPSSRQLRGRESEPVIDLSMFPQSGDKNEWVVRYSLAGSSQPIAIASYDLLPPAEQQVLPCEDDLRRALDTDL